MSHENALAPVPEIPAHLAKLMNESGDYRNDIGHISPRDIRAPFIKVVSGMSKEGKPGWGPTGTESPMPYGTIILSHNKKVLAPGTVVVPLLRRVVYIKWEGGEPGTRMLGFATREDDPKITAENGLEFKPNPQNPKESLKPAWDTYINFYVLCEAYMEQPVVLSFYRTSLKTGRAFTQEIFQATRGMKLPLYCLKYKLGMKEVEADGRRWPTLTLTPDGMISEAGLPIATKMYESAQFLANASNSAEFIQELAGASDAAGATITVTPTNAAPPPEPSTPPAQSFKAAQGAAVTPPAPQQHVTMQSPPQATQPAQAAPAAEAAAPANAPKSMF